MSPLVPEKRTDRNGRVVTRHVRDASPAPKGASRIPAVRSPVTSGTGVRKPVEPRPKQLEQQHFTLKSLSLPASPALGYGPAPYPRTHEFTASAVEFYDVLAVASDADAVRLLKLGYRDAEEAAEKIRGGGGEPLDRRELVDELLRRNISPQAMAEYGLSFGVPAGAEHTPQQLADAVELFSIAAFRPRDVYHDVLNEVLNGEIRIEDIKAVGATRLKVSDRLAASKDLLKALARGEAKFTVGDMRWALDECAPEGNGISARTTTGVLYGAVALCLLHGGRELFDLGAEMRLVYHVHTTLGYLGHERAAETYEALAYEVEARLGTTMEMDSKVTITQALIETRGAGIPAKVAGELIAAGMTADQVIAVHRGQTTKALGEGWL